jgi:gas vesicle protein
MARNRRQERQPEEIDAGLTILGMGIGMLIGGVFTLFNAPQSGSKTRQQITNLFTHTGDTLRTKIDQVVTADPVAESMAEGKAAARRRRAELGLLEQSD